MGKLYYPIGDCHFLYANFSGVIYKGFYPRCRSVGCTLVQLSPRATQKVTPEGLPLRFVAHSNDALLKRGTEFLRGRSPVLVLAGAREAADDLVRSCCSPLGGALTGVYRH